MINLGLGRVYIDSFDTAVPTTNQTEQPDRRQVPLIDLFHSGETRIAGVYM